MLAAALLAAAAAAAPPASPRASPPAPAPAFTDVLDQIDRVVTERFYSPEVLEKTHWKEAVARARGELGSRDPDRVFAELVAGLKTSHTTYYPRSQPQYWELASVFESMLPQMKDHCAARDLPPKLPVERDSLGVLWKELEGAWFVGGVFPGGPADQAGLLLGDEVVEADGKAFNPVRSLAGRKSVALRVRREPHDPLLQLTAKPRHVKIHDELADAIGQSARVIERGAARIGYVHVWSWAGSDMHDAVRAAIGDLNRKGVTHFVLDLRDGWGGAGPDYVSIFDRTPAVLVSKDRKGNTFTVDSQIRVPAVLLVNGGSRSGKEAVALSVQKHKLATLVGENTAGALLPGSPFCLRNGAILFLAVGSLTVDGAVLEGKGVAPDVHVPFDVRWAGGKDPQLDKALELLAGRPSP